MIRLLLKMFVKDYEKTEKEEVRERYGMLSGCVGIICNIFLFGVKYYLGTIACSVAIISDAFNNLSDSGSCILTLFGYKMAAKPADKDHPFGHGRMEYVISLLVAVVIMLVGVELFQSSVEKIKNPEPVLFSKFVLIALLVSVLVKLWMAYFNRTLGKKIRSTVMLATAKDSLNDVIATGTTILALVASLFTDFPLDGYIGCVVSVFILYSGFEIIKDTADEFLGKPADKQTVQAIRDILERDEQVKGLHDMVIHSYGPGVTFGSVHAEVDARENIMVIHDAIDRLEKEVYDKLHVVLTVHMDPVEMDNTLVNERKEMVRRILHSINPELSFHDFRMVGGAEHTNLLFDIVLPFDCKMKEKEVLELLNQELEKEDGKYCPVVNIERDYTQ